MAQKPGFFERLRNTVASKVRQLSDSAITRARQIARALAGMPSPGSSIMQDRKQLRTIMTPEMLGRLCIFFYMPKHKEELPYYDRFPMIVPLEIYEDGFLGMNLHYLPPHIRARVMDGLYDNIYRVQGPEDLKNRRRLQIAYHLLKASSKNKLFVPTIKRYLSTHLNSKIYVLKEEDWDMALYLPSERFVKETKEFVWRDSMRIIREAR